MLCAGLSGENRQARILVTASSTHTQSPYQSRLATWLEILAIVSLGLAIALPLRGHYLKPHADFIGFHDTADALADGDFGASHKRAPVYPALLAIGGGALRKLGFSDPPPRIVFAGWLNSLLLPVNAVLVLLIARHWLAALRLPLLAARWVSIVFLILPLGISLSAHLLVEPLLTAMTLAAVLAGGCRHRALAYLVAATATMTRYDAAGLLAGLVFADALTGKKRTAILRGVLGVLPLMAWLGLTALYWEREVGDHYVQQIFERPQFSPMEFARVILDAAFALPRVHLPAWLDVDALLVGSGLRLLFVGSMAIGLWRLIFLRERSMIVAAGFALGYWFVHAVFPFSYERFGYPLSPLVLIAAGVGVTALVCCKRPAGSAGAMRPAELHFLSVLLYSASAILAAILLVGNIDTIADALRMPRASWHSYLTTCAILGSLAAAVFARFRVWPANLAIFLGIVPGLVPAQLREACGWLGTGEDRCNLVTTAKWIATNVPRDGMVLTDLGGLIRIYGGPCAIQSVGYEEIGADSWPEIVGELRSRGVRYITWHDDIFAEFADAFYASRLRLERFMRLGDSEIPHEIESLAELPGDPNVRIFEIR